MNKLFAFIKSYFSSSYQTIDTTSAGLSVAIVMSLWMAVYCIFAYGVGYGIEAVPLVESLLPGYSLTLGGSIVGIVWVFSLGYIFGSFFAWIYNKLVKKPRF